MNYTRSGITACVMLFCTSTQAALHTQSSINELKDHRTTLKLQQYKPITMWSKINANKRLYGSIAIGCSSLLATFLLSHHSAQCTPSTRIFLERHTPSCKSLSIIPIGSLFYLSHWLDKKENHRVAKPPKNGPSALLEKYLPTAKTLSKISLASGSALLSLWTYHLFNNRSNSSSKIRDRALQLRLNDEDKKSGYTLLHRAAIDGDEPLCIELIEAGANLDAKDTSGYTPLHIAAEKGLGQTCTALIEQGADMQAKTIEGKTPLQIAKESGFQLESILNRDTCRK